MSSAKKQKRSRMALMLSVLTHPLRAEILERLIERPSSPSEIASALASPVAVVDYHTKRLAEAGFARLVKRERPVGSRGHPQKFYGADPLHISDDEWMRVPALVRAALTTAALRELAARGQNVDSVAEGPVSLESSPDANLARIHRELVGMLGSVATSLLRVVGEAESVAGDPGTA